MKRRFLKLYWQQNIMLLFIFFDRVVSKYLDKTKQNLFSPCPESRKIKCITIHRQYEKSYAYKNEKLFWKKKNNCNCTDKKDCFFFSIDIWLSGWNGYGIDTIEKSFKNWAKTMGLKINRWETGMRREADTEIGKSFT